MTSDRKEHSAFRNVPIAVAALGALVGGLALGSAAGPEALNLLREWRDRPLEIGAPLPTGTVMSASGEKVGLSAVVSGAPLPVYLLLLSATCQNCLGELKAWDDAVRSGAGMDARLVAVIKTDDEEYLQLVDSLIDPSYAVWSMDGALEGRLRARRVPTIYRIDESGTVVGAWVGRDAAAGLRSRDRPETHPE